MAETNESEYEYDCVVCGGHAIVVWIEGERREVHIVEPRGHAPVRQPDPVQPEEADRG